VASRRTTTTGRDVAVNDLPSDQGRVVRVVPADPPPDVEPGNPYVAGLRFAWWGRVSTEDQQDPTLSLPRQLHSARTALPVGAIIVAHYFDVESGRKSLSARGYSVAHERFDIAIPRDGGIQDLLAEAKSPTRRFDAVICESIDRVARRTYYGTQIEHDLEAAGVALFAADEPVSLNGKRATTILTRRVKQGVAEWYVLETLEKAWDGFCEHTRQGWNVGVPPYGYLAEKIPHPVPARRAEGKTKTRLVPDPDRDRSSIRSFAGGSRDWGTRPSQSGSTPISIGTRCPARLTPPAGAVPGAARRCATCSPTPSTPGTWSGTGAPRRRVAGSTPRMPGYRPSIPPTSRWSPKSSSTPRPPSLRSAGVRATALGPTWPIPTPNAPMCFARSSFVRCAGGACSERHEARMLISPVSQC
jgi:DNA invertase Pin-like site-specific DNA recombinase